MGLKNTITLYDLLIREYTPAAGVDGPDPAYLTFGGDVATDSTNEGTAFSITVSNNANVAAEDTITITIRGGARVLRCKASGANADSYEFNKGVDANATAANIAACINGGGKNYAESNRLNNGSLLKEVSTDVFAVATLNAVAFSSYTPAKDGIATTSAGISVAIESAPTFSRYVSALTGGSTLVIGLPATINSTQWDYPSAIIAWLLERIVCAAEERSSANGNGRPRYASRAVSYNQRTGLLTTTYRISLQRSLNVGVDLGIQATVDPEKDL